MVSRKWARWLACVNEMNIVLWRRKRKGYLTPIETSKPAGVVWKLFVATPALLTSRTVSRSIASIETNVTHRGYPSGPPDA